MTSKLTAQDFKNPLLTVLGELTQNKPDVPIDLKTTYQPVCKIMGITIDQFGNDSSSGQPKVEKWIQWAFKDHKNDGYTKTMGRGQWALTSAGVQIMNTAMIPAKANDVVVLDAAIKPEHTYHNDEYIRTLAAQETKCFGLYGQQSPICKDCPLNDACMNAMMVELVSLNKTLVLKDARDEANKHANQNPISNVPKTPSVSQSAPTGSADSVLIHQTSMCSKCQKPIAKGTHAMWVASEKGGSAGLYHKECYEGDGK